MKQNAIMSGWNGWKNRKHTNKCCQFQETSKCLWSNEINSWFNDCHTDLKGGRFWKWFMLNILALFNWDLVFLYQFALEKGIRGMVIGIFSRVPFEAVIRRSYLFLQCPLKGRKIVNNWKKRRMLKNNWKKRRMLKKNAKNRKKRRKKKFCLKSLEIKTFEWIVTLK